MGRNASSFRLRNGLYLVFMLAVAFYGFLAMQAGQHNLPAATEASRPAALDAARVKGDAGATLAEMTRSEIDAYPVWVNLMGQVSSTRYTYGSDGINEISTYYAVMPSTQKTILSTHMMLGGTCIILGLFQFWPAFRRRYRKAHRIMGAVYITAALAAMTMSVLHLLHAGVANTYQTFVFHVGLWMMVVGVVSSLVLAGYYLWRRNIAAHLGWQAIGYGFLLTAPVQRYDWMLVGYFFPDISQGAGNGLVNVLLFWQCLLLGYLLFCWNRAESAPRSALLPSAPGARVTAAKALALAVGAAAVITIVEHYLLNPGLAGAAAAQALIPASFLASDTQLFAGSLLPPVFAAALITALVSTLYLVTRREVHGVRVLSVVAALVAGAIQVSWGWLQGGPSATTFSGGGFYMVTGLSMIAFALLTLAAGWRNRADLRSEWTIFLFLFTLSAPTLFWALDVMHALDLVPGIYAAKGHAYMIAAIVPLTNAMLVGIVAAIHGRETAGRVIN